MLKRLSLVRINAVVVMLWLLAGCASVGGPRHIAAVSILTAHSTLAAIQDTEALVVCGTPTAPPKCMTPPEHRAFAAKLVAAFDLDAQVLRQVRAWPAGAPLPPAVTNALTQIRTLVTELLALIPKTPQKDQLLVSLGGA